MASLYYQGHGSFRLTTSAGAVIYIDPYAGDGYDIPADAILITHEHGDHNQVKLVTCKKKHVVLNSGDMIAKDGTYKTVELCGCVIRAVQAYNKNHKIDACVGYIIETDGLKLYFAGDTSMTEDMSKMADMHIDYAFLPTDGIYNMDAKEASVCAKLIAARHSVPVHTKPGALFDESVAAMFECDGKLVMKPGTEAELIGF